MAVTIVRQKARGSVQDRLWQFSTAQAITTDAISENVMDLGSHNVDGRIQIGTGTKKRIEIVVTTAFAGGTSMEFQFVTDEAATLDTGPTVLATSGVILDAALTLGTLISIDIPEGVAPDRYIGMNYVDVGAHSAGTIDCYLAG